MVLPLPEVRATLYHEAHMKNLVEIDKVAADLGKCLGRMVK